jgi:Domain of unknown function (DUF4326)
MSPMPKRIQRKRTKGWRMPEGVVYVGRPTKWGNPFKVDSDWRSAFRAAFLVGLGNREGQRKCVVELYRLLLIGDKRPLTDEQRAIHEKNFWQKEVMTIEPEFEPPSLDEIRAELRGKDLACFCPLDQPCHADVLLELANT